MNITKQDRKAIEDLKHDSSLEPSFDVIKNCLVWDDERPTGVTSAGYELICDLLIVRSFLHQGIPREKWGLAPEYFSAVWDDARTQGLRWPGFERVELSVAEKQYFESCVANTRRGEV